MWCFKERKMSSRILAKKEISWQFHWKGFQPKNRVSGFYAPNQASAHRAVGRPEIGQRAFNSSGFPPRAQETL